MGKNVKSLFKIKRDRALVSQYLNKSNEFFGSIFIVIEETVGTNVHKYESVKCETEY